MGAQQVKEVDPWGDFFGKMGDIIELPLEKQATYADQICAHATLNGEDWIHQQALNPETKFHLWNSTSVGNTAFMALHSKREDVRKHCREKVEMFCEWYRNKK